MEKIRLGLFGTGIGRSNAPRLHKTAARLCGLELSYGLFDLDNRLETFETQFAQMGEQGFTGVNVTHPFKERAAKLVTSPDPAIESIGAINTVRYADKTGYNTDYTGFIKAYRRRFGEASPGRVLLVGTGGAGKAVAYALAALKVKGLHLVDSDSAKAESLAHELRQQAVACDAHSPESLGDLADVDGLINCTPLGMYQHPGTAIPKALIEGQSWAFDAVYLPQDTQFLQDAKAAGLELLSGYELHFYQGVDAFEIFTGVRVDEFELRRELKATAKEASSKR